jgi:hypothetical protein
VIARGLRAFGAFWLDFLIGDTPEIFIGVLVIVGGALLLRHDRVAGLTAVIVLAVVVLVASAARGRKRT